jgi:hypothetical protein
MSRQRTLLSIAAMVTVGASAFVLPVRQPVSGPALCARRASATTAARALSMQAVSQDELKKQVRFGLAVWRGVLCGDVGTRPSRRSSSSVAASGFGSIDWIGRPAIQTNGSIDKILQVGYKSVDDYVKSGMVVGLGTGSTAAFAGMSYVRVTHLIRPIERPI